VRRCMTDKQEHEAPSNWGNTKESNSRTLHLGISCKSSSSERCDDLNRSKRYVEEDGMEGIKSEVRYYQRAECGYASTWHSVTC
jgi:hypothetical protein